MTNNNNISFVFNKLKQNGGLSNFFTYDEIRKAYRKVSLKYHPDKGGDEETMKQITSICSMIEKDHFKKNPKISSNDFQKYLRLKRRQGNVQIVSVDPSFKVVLGIYLLVIVTIVAFVGGRLIVRKLYKVVRKPKAIHTNTKRKSNKKI